MPPRVTRHPLCSLDPPAPAARAHAARRYDRARLMGAGHWSAKAAADLARVYTLIDGFAFLIEPFLAAGLALSEWLSSVGSNPNPNPNPNPTPGHCTR